MPRYYSHRHPFGSRFHKCANIWHLAFWAWLILLSMTISRCIHFSAYFHCHPLYFRLLGCFTSLVIVNRAAIPKSLQGPLLYLHSFACMFCSAMSVILFVWCVTFSIDLCWTILTSLQWNWSWCMTFFQIMESDLDLVVEFGSQVFDWDFFIYIHQWDGSVILFVVVSLPFLEWCNTGFSE
jgi:hypothetical protein